MGFALWIDGDQAWAQGLHEYRPMGAAVISLTDNFRPRDFNARRRAPSRGDRNYAGLFASLGEVNVRLAAIRRSRASRKNRKGGLSSTPSWI